MWMMRWMLIGGVTLFLMTGTFSDSEARSSRSIRRPARVVSETRSLRSIRRAPPKAGAPAPAVAAHPPLPARRTFQAVLLQDADTGRILFAQNSDKQWPAASLTKMMVALLTLEEVARGRLSLRTPVIISKRASRAGGRTINLRPGERFSLEELLQAMLVTSANDAAVAVAERLKGSVEACVKTMNQRAQELGMERTRYQTVNGMPPTKGTPPDISSAADMAILARALLRHPQILEWTSLNRIPFRAGRVMLPNTNHLIGKVAGVNGLKTGYTNKARFNLVTTAQRDQMRLIAVVMGGQSSRIRFRIATDLLEWGFTHFIRLQPIKSDKPDGAEARVEHGSGSMLQPVTARDVILLMRKGEGEDVQVPLRLPTVIAAPIFRYQVLREMAVHNGKQVSATIPTLSPWDIPEAYWFPVQQ